MTNRAPPDEWLGHLIHLNRRLHARVYLLLFERVLQRQRVDHRGQHSHMIGGNPVHVPSLIGHAAKEVAAAYNDRKLHSQFVYVSQFGRNLMDACCVDAEALIGSESLSGKFEQNAFKGRSFHEVSSFRFPVSSSRRQIVDTMQHIQCLETAGHRKPETRNSTSTLEQQPRHPRPAWAWWSQQSRSRRPP